MADPKTDFRLRQALAERLGMIIHSLVDTVLPPTCLSCDAVVARQGGVCPHCWSQLQFIEKPVCPVYGTPFSQDLGPQALSAQAIADPPEFDRARSVVIYEAVSRSIINGLKFSDRSDLAPWMARWMARAGADLAEPGALIVPVPLHRGRLFARRFNQSAELARHLSSIWGLDFHGEMLMRRRATRQQVGLGASGRWRNVRGAFQVPLDQQINVHAQHLILIDDVFTTGATVRACARALRRKGARKIDCLTFARVGNGVAGRDQ